MSIAKIARATFAFVLCLGVAASPAVAKPMPETQRPLALFIGDSFTVGNGSPNLKAGFAYQLASHYRWRMANFAVGHTGYLKGDQPGGGLEATTCDPKRGCPNYEKQVDQAIAEGVVPDIVIVSGGFNDTASPEMRQAALSLFAKLHSKFASARVFVTSPITTDVVTADLLARIDIVRNACKITATVFLDLKQPLAGKKLLRDHIHPNGPGHTVLAKAIATLLDKEFAKKT